MYCSDAARRHNLYAEVLSLIQHFADFVFHHLFSEGEKDIAVQVESQRGCTVCCLHVGETHRDYCNYCSTFRMEMKPRTLLWQCPNHFLTEITILCRHKTWYLYVYHKVSIFQALDLFPLLHCLVMVHILLPHESLLWQCHKVHGPDALWIHFNLLHSFLGLWELNNPSRPSYSCAPKRAPSTDPYVQFQLHFIQAVSNLLGYINCLGSGLCLS